MMHWLDSLQWHYPMIGLLALLPPAGWIYVFMRRRQTQEYADASLRPWALRRAGPFRGTGRWLGISVFWWLLSAAAAGPYVIELTSAEDGVALARSDVELILVVETGQNPGGSGPLSYREKIQRAFHDLGAVAQGERIGLVSAGIRADLVYPPSHDYQLFSFYFPLLEKITPGESGNAIAEALALSRQTLIQRDAGSRMVLLLPQAPPTPSQADKLFKAAQSLAGSGIAFSVMPAASHDEAEWEQIAQAGNGETRLLPRGRDAWQRAYQDMVATLPSDARATSATRIQREEFSRFLVPALLMWFVVVSARSLSPRLLMMGLVFLAALVQPLTVRADEALHRAFDAYRQGQYLQAQRLFAGASGATARMGQGAAAYQRGDYEDATRYFKQALLLATDDETRADALFNLGNTWYRLKRFDLAVQSYYGVFDYRQQDTAARHNLFLASRLLPRPVAIDGDNRAGRPGQRFSIDGPAPEQEVTDEPEFVFSDQPGGSASRQQESEAGQRVARGEALASTGGDDSLRRTTYQGRASTRAAFKKLELIEDKPAQLLRALAEREASLRNLTLETSP